MLFEYNRNNRYFAQVQRRLEPIALEELEGLGASACTQSYCGVYFEADTPTLYKINYCARTIIRILAPLFHFNCPNEDALYKNAYQFPWEDILSVFTTFAIDSNVSNSRINHSRFAALRLKDAIVDRFSNKFGKRPDVDTQNPQIRLNLNIDDDRAIVSFDTSGESLHRRGYRLSSVEAPLQETLAAAILRITRWNGDVPFIDPMCGSGTFLAEALMKYCNIPPAFKRNTFGFFNLPGFDRKLWNDIKKETDKKIRDLPPSLITGSDIDPEAIKAASRNLKSLPGGIHVKLETRDFQSLGKQENSLILTNPPYGVRLKKPTDSPQKLYDLYKNLGDFFKKRCTQSTAFILCGEKELTKHIGLRISQRVPLFNGALDSRLVRINIYDSPKNTEM